jgi:hypothetical protein
MISSKNENENENLPEFNIEINGNDNQQKTTIDLNKIFHIDLSYNFDLLKNLLSTIIKNQKTKDDKILDLENQLLNFKILLNDTLKDPEATKKLLESKSRISTLLLKGKEFPDTSCLNYVITRPREINIEPSPNNEPIINQIIVSYIYIYII